MWVGLHGWLAGQVSNSIKDSNNNNNNKKKKMAKPECLAGPKVKVHPNITMQTSRPFNKKPRSHMLKTQIRHRRRNGGNMGCCVCIDHDTVS